MPRELRNRAQRGYAERAKVRRDHNQQAVRAIAQKQKRPRFPAGVSHRKPSGDYSSSSPFFFCARERAAPRMSPRLAPESDEPYCATASFSSATSRALIERPILRPALSAEVTSASSLLPTPKRSGR